MNSTNKQDGKVALVTGGARRIGASIVKALHEAGFKVAIHCHHSLNEAHTEAVRLNQKRKDSAFVLQEDLTYPGAGSEIVQRVQAWAGRLDLLVNNASVFTRTNLNELHSDQWDLLFNTNVKAPFFLSLAACASLAQHQGLIINITDIHAQKPLQKYSAYCQTKAALEMQTRALALEFAPEVRVNAIAPGAILWPEKENRLSPMEQEKIINKTPLKRHGHPKCIAQMVLALVENSFITGQIIRVDGGRSLV